MNMELKVDLDGGDDGGVKGEVGVGVEEVKTPWLKVQR